MLRGVLFSSIYLRYFLDTTVYRLCKTFLDTTHFYTFFSVLQCVRVPLLGTDTAPASVLTAAVQAAADSGASSAASLGGQCVYYGISYLFFTKVDIANMPDVL